ncbi:PTS sugar transporter subunit IIA [Staphylococcus intermedius]|uniref:Ascorbate-specific PTS system EIIA component n=1 Tax=Staphylococcus intermedius NCTC 11048 TaxID=1141106 RepID=A0A380G3E1_STAIN|nr:PTS sugar transporter subunit IIA [Staphylococcus intermedius]PCF64018.1 PTS ascorbate transporter subunit IIA [Staphylococcus intermedius]PCF78733.1 PTS ascorbate transporter subunit IIA [Staphylococcus intermedius]PCF79706.1 PTS ascorbate transporter subunit IIA [Staphylococcus intermedius]PCF85944.1 PTS ascorbate transporter subunit IIA [Staphylococcus intermedius]PCF89635.1 PTS ascorbate transporter subunit IIA [Staphylococcus intermedius]
MSLEMLTEDKINVKEYVATWEEAIKVAAQPLLDQAYFNPSYVDAMIDSVYRHGPYIVIAPEIAIAHARPNGNVNKVGLSLLKLHRHIDFGEKSHYASLIFVFSAVDTHSHLDILQSLARILGDVTTVNRLMQSQNAAEIVSIIKGVEQR